MSSSTGHLELSDRLDRYAADLAELGAIRSAPVRHAFATVPRHRFLRAFYYRGERFELPPDTPPTPDLLDIIYANNSLLTHNGSDGDPTSSSSSPSVMARMLEALDLRPGMRVLEIGAGTGYNAALINAITGEPVTTIEAGRVAATQLRAVIDALGLSARIRLVHGDGYLGDPAGGRYDRIIATCGIAGIPASWRDQLTDDGMVLAPIAHAGAHPIIAAHPEGQILRGRCALWADFMPAGGQLRPAALVGHDPSTLIPAITVGRDLNAVPCAGADRYNDLAVYLGAHDNRTSRAYVDHPDFDPTCGATALVDHDAAVWVQHGPDLVHAGPDTAVAPLRERMRNLVHDWSAAGKPAATDWSVSFTATYPADTNLLVPSRWENLAGGTPGDA